LLAKKANLSCLIHYNELQKNKKPPEGSLLFAFTEYGYRYE
jgi:hypothetical protein|tara:strand:- start:2640 stop:2762 length:123 start_codon:yes stop_codon:yes gene_type:complete